jgi:hypothetical protein
MANMLVSSETESRRDVTFGPMALRLSARWVLEPAGGSARVDSEIGQLVFKATGRDEPVVSEPVELPGEAVHRLRLELATQCSRPNRVYVDDMTAARPLRLLVGVCKNDDVANPRDATYWVRYVVLADAGRLTVDMKGLGSLVEARTRMDPILVNARVR